MKQKNAAIDLLKFLFAMMILLFHGGKNLPGQVSLFPNGRIGVEFFFLVSGYLMAASAARLQAPEGEKLSVWRSTASFIGHKIARLSPDVFIAWFVAYGVTMAARGYGFTTAVLKLFSGLFELLFLQRAGFVGQVSVNGATWYLSGMLLAMALLVPLLLTKRDCYLHWFAPLAAILLYGYLNQIWQNGLAGTVGWGGFATKGLLRALAGLNLGVVCYTAAGALGRLRLKGPARLLASLTAVCCFLFVALHVHTMKQSSYDYVLVLLLAVGVTVTFSGAGLAAPWLSASGRLSGICAWLGAFSLDLYLSHGYWSNLLEHFLPGLTGRRMLLAYLSVCFANALLLMLVSGWLRRRWPAIRAGLRRLCIEE